MDLSFGRRGFLGGLAGLAGAASLGGLVDAVSPAPAEAVVTNGRGRDGITAARPRRGGTLVVGLTSEQQGFNPASARFDASGFVMARTVYDPLFAISAQGTVLPYLARSIRPNRAHTAWEVTLRPGIRFHDGTPLDAKGMVESFQAGLSSPLAGIAIQPLVDGAEQTGELSWVVHLKRPWTSFPYTYASTQIGFVASPSMAALPSQGSAHPIGTGPFVFEEWVPNDHFSVTANPHYWRPGLPQLERIVFKPIPDDNARAQALDSGAVDLIISADVSVIQRYRGARSVSYVDNSGRMVGSPNVAALMLNLSKPPFDDPLARRILATGISASAYSKVITKGVEAPVNGIFQPGSPFHTKVPYPSCSLPKARALSAEYAKKHGHPLRFESLGIASPQSTQQGAYISQVLRSIGVEITMKQLNESQLISEALDGSFEAVGWQSFGGIYPDLNYVWFSPKTIRPTGMSLNMARNDDPQIQRALEAGMAATTPAAARAAFAKVNERLAVDLPYIWTTRAVWAVASKPRVQNWNNPKAPSGAPLLGMDQGVIWLGQAWLS